MTPGQITLILPSLHGGGAERVAVNLAEGFVQRGIQVQMILLEGHGAQQYVVHESVDIVAFGHARALGALFDLRAYLQKNKPDAIISFLNQANLVVLLAHWLANSQIPVIATVHSGIDNAIQESFKDRAIILLSRLFAGRAKQFVGVSQGTSESIRRHLHKQHVTTVYNPVVTPDLIEETNAAPPHPWLVQQDTPVVVTAGRLASVKGFDILIRAIAVIRETISVRLLILGEGPLRSELESLVEALGLQDAVLLPGFVENPYSYFVHADLFALSSRYEGLGNALIEAMACGCPVVSTDCPSGPREILQDGTYGRLVPVDDAAALASAIVDTLSAPPDIDVLRTRADDFSLEKSIDGYLRVIEAITA